MNAITTRMKRISKTDGSAVIPPSHKWTEVGVLPKDWSVRSLRSCLLSVPSYGINEAAVPFDDDLPTYLRITDISKDGQFRPSPRVSVKHPNGQAFFLNEGDLVLARTGASVGKSYLYNSKDGPLVFAGFLIRISPNPEKVQPTFLAYCLQSKYYWNWVATMSIRSGQPGINGQEYGELQLPLPPLIEQRAIAEALSDVDGLINALEALIAKKQAIKQAVMQQLLTGKTRLPGFSRAWETKRLGDITKIQKGSLITEKDVVPGTIPVIAGGQKPAYFHNIANRTGKTVTVSASGAYAGFVALHNQPIFASDCSTISENSSFSIDFIYYYLVFNQDVIYNAQTGGAQPHIHPVDLMPLQVDLPPFSEQRAIATVLSDMDADITALEQRRDKTRSIKQGMMQAVLTGQVRLPESRIIADDTDDAN